MHEYLQLEANAIADGCDTTRQAWFFGDQIRDGTAARQGIWRLASWLPASRRQVLVLYAIDCPAAADPGLALVLAAVLHRLAGDLGTDALLSHGRRHDQ